MWDSGEEEDEEEKSEEKVEDEQPSMVGRIHIPRPSFTISPTHTNNGNGETTTGCGGGEDDTWFIFSVRTLNLIKPV